MKYRHCLIESCKLIKGAIDNRTSSNKEQTEKEKLSIQFLIDSLRLIATFLGKHKEDFKTELEELTALKASEIAKISVEEADTLSHYNSLWQRVDAAIHNLKGIIFDDPLRQYLIDAKNVIKKYEMQLETALDADTKNKTEKRLLEMEAKITGIENEKNHYLNQIAQLKNQIITFDENRTSVQNKIHEINLKNVNQKTVGELMQLFSVFNITLPAIEGLANTSNRHDKYIGAIVNVTGKEPEEWKTNNPDIYGQYLLNRIVSPVIYDTVYVLVKFIKERNVNKDNRTEANNLISLLLSPSYFRATWSIIKEDIIKKHIKTLEKNKALYQPLLKKLYKIEEFDSSDAAPTHYTERGGLEILVKSFGLGRFLPEDKESAGALMEYLNGLPNKSIA